MNDHPEDGQSAWLLSRAKTSLGELDTAMTLAESALAFDDTNPAYHVQIALVAGKHGQGFAGLPKQLTLVRRARERTPTPPLPPSIPIILPPCTA